jgi:UDP-N-acetylmuramyl pentapeptide phosphotransferase/UDP-N-acetylglucosamine-1-phosphate transferase
MILVILDRYRSGASLVHGDRRHLHFRLRDTGWTSYGILGFYYLASLLFGLSTLLLTSWQKVFALLLLFTLTLLAWYSLKKRV